MTKLTVSGWVTRYQSGFYTIQTESGKITCILRGRLKRRTIQGDIISIGDRVQISLQSDGTGAVEVIEPRHSELVRLDPTPRGAFRQILLSNPDQVVAVFACAQPEPHLRMLDRFLVIAEKQQLKAVVVANKVDLIGLKNAKKIFSDYPPLGYPVIYTSAKKGDGLEELKGILEGKISALAGPSGVGKSSLLNAIQPGLGLAVREIGARNERGRHTTVVREMFPIEGGGYVADLPGLRKLSLWDTQPEELDGYFPEIRHLVSQCQFNDCAHFDDPGCAVVKAVEEGGISAERYESYVRMRLGDA
ncbi:MAG: ribosome bioproteinis GTPase [Chloroflexi bacterium]|nr:MAG: ribosome bioproteinis GTPase [Chloroflexota bacterium]MBA4374925.1 ribosome small subunit-dependent GTPase A [Anaerolinea sp.]